MRSATAHLLAGQIGAGKTTYAHRLADQEGGVVLSIDDWMAGLFGPDMPQPLDFGWVQERVRRCETRILAETIQVLQRGQDVVLDLGFTTADTRRLVAGQIRSAGQSVRLHWLDVPKEERWRRVSYRNNEQGATYALRVTRAMFDFMEERFEPPTAEELDQFNGQIVTAG